MYVFYTLKRKDGSVIRNELPEMYEYLLFVRITDTQVGLQIHTYFMNNNTI